MKKLIRILSLAAVLGVTMWGPAHAIVYTYCYMECSDGSIHRYTNIGYEDCCNLFWQVCGGSGFCMLSSATTTQYCS
jgi:hypothetical protein